MKQQGALDGITVLDLSRMLPGPYCSMMLADHGARVIAIEDRMFEVEGSFPTIVNRNKEHMSLNLKKQEGREIFYRLLEGADVVLEGFRPGVAARLGVDYETLKEKNPGIVYCSITGYGQTGPLKERPGHDVNYLGEAGLLDLVGTKEGPPSIPGFQVADVAGGSLHALTGILMALFARTATGKGQYIDISMTDCCFPMHAINMNMQQLTGESPKRSSMILSHGYAFYNTYETRDGRFLTLGALEPRFWKVLCECLEVPHFIPLQFDAGKREEVIAFMRETFKKKTLGEWEAELGDLPICWGPVRTLKEAMDSPLFREREMVVEMTDRYGRPTRTFGVPIKMSDTPGCIRTAPVGFGESTRSILGEIGMDNEKITSLLDKEVI